METKNTGLLLTLGACALLLIGFGTGYVSHTPPEPQPEWKLTPLKYPGFELWINGKPYPFPDHIKLSGKDGDKGKDGKRKPGDVGDLGPAAWLIIDQDPLQLNGPHMVNVVAKLEEKKKADCPCGDSCTCNPCHCHAAKTISFGPGEDDTATPVVGQRGGSPKSPELFGIDTLAKAFDRFIDKVFGTPGKNDGLKDEIAGGLKAWSNTFTWVVIGVVTVHFILKIWQCWSLQKLADKA